MNVDKEKLLAWLTGKSFIRSAIAHAIYKGLADRITRGEFDVEETR